MHDLSLSLAGYVYIKCGPHEAYFIQYKLKRHNCFFRKGKGSFFTFYCCCTRFLPLSLSVSMFLLISMNVNLKDFRIETKQNSKWLFPLYENSLFASFWSFILFCFILFSSMHLKCGNHKQVFDRNPNIMYTGVSQVYFSVWENVPILVCKNMFEECNLRFFFLSEISIGLCTVPFFLFMLWFLSFIW